MLSGLKNIKGKTSAARQGARYNIMVLSTVLGVLIVTTLVQVFYTWESVNTELANRKRMETNIHNERVEALKNDVAMAVANSAAGFEHELKNPDNVRRLLNNMLSTNPIILGAAVAYVPNYLPEKGKLYSIYAYRGDETLRTLSLRYDYTEYDWYLNVIEKKQSGWCQPYVDGDATYDLMITYSMPLRDSLGHVVAVLTGDLPMTSVTYVQGKIYSQVSTRSIILLSIQIFGILLILFISWKAVVSMRRIGKVAEEEKYVGYERGVAARLQQTIIPKEKPEHQHLDLAARLLQAEVVSGDFYDYFLKDDKLYFCIGDVATRGIGAALAMLVTRTTYRSGIAWMESPAAIARQMNDALYEINEQQMFATAFVGVLDLKTGELCYCNAGHTAPILAAGGVASQLEVVSNVPIGLAKWEFVEQHIQLQPGSLLFLYTDGVVETVSPQGEPFGEKRLKLHLRNVAQAGDNAEAATQQVVNAVTRFTGVDEPKLDDVTILVVGYR